MGLGHVFSLPGGYVGLCASALIMKHMKSTGPLAWLGAGFAGFIIGFLVAQFAICNTAMYCGVLSIF